MLGVYTDVRRRRCWRCRWSTGRRATSEKFAGALRTYSIEALMGDGRALQAGTSHNLGQNFAKAFDITVPGARQDGAARRGTTSWGVSTRLIGGVIMTHGDDSGLVLPPRVAPYQVVIVPIPRGNWQETVLPKARGDPARARGGRHPRHARRARRDTPGWKFAEWELRGVPLRLEIGPKDIEKSQVVLARRDTREKHADADGRPGRARQRAARRRSSRRCFDRALRVPRRAHARATDATTSSSRSMEGRPGFVIAPWCGVGDCEAADQGRDAGDDPQHAVRGRALAATCIRCDRPAITRRGSRRRTSGLDRVGSLRVLSGGGSPDWRVAPPSNIAVYSVVALASQAPRSEIHYRFNRTGQSDFEVVLSSEFSRSGSWVVGESSPEPKTQNREAELNTEN